SIRFGFGAVVVRVGFVCIDFVMAGQVCIDLLMRPDAVDLILLWVAVVVGSLLGSSSFGGIVLRYCCCAAQS
ncbi:hypothetical protein U1Q18_030868, partial [Sarracenia purpurea var. burkii]